MSTIHATNDEIVTYNLAGAGIIAIQAIPSFVVFVCSLAITKVHNDPARTWLIQLRIALAFFLVYVRPSSPFLPQIPLSWHHPVPNAPGFEEDS